MMDRLDILEDTFTFHNVSINSIACDVALAIQADLHSIMYLLIPYTEPTG